MKFKLLTVFLGLIAFGSLQTVSAISDEDNVTLNVVLKPIQTLTIKGDRIVNLEYKTRENYDEGVSVEKADHIEIYSTGGFEVKVKSSGPLVGTSTDNIDASDIKVVASKGTSNSLNPSFSTGTVLGTEGATLLTSEVGGVDQTFNIKYEAAGGNKYLNLYKGENPTIFETTVTYTIFAK